jgi:hypothetical protein
MSCIFNFLGYHKGTFHMGIKIFYSYPFEIMVLTNNVKWLKRTLNNFLYFHSFCSLKEYIDLNNHKSILHGSHFTPVLCLLYILFQHMFLLLYVVYYIVTSPCLYYMSYILSGPILYQMVSVSTQI